MKTDKEKMLAGELYNGMAKDLLLERIHTKDLLYDFNHCRPSNMEERDAIIRQVLGSVGSDFYIEPPFLCDYGYNISVGNNVFINYNCTILDCNTISIGNNVLIGPNVNLYAATHPTDSATRNQGLEYALPISIGNNVWIGGNVCVLPGVSIGDNCVIGTGSIVNKSIPANSIAVGNPCRVIKQTS